MPAIFIDTNILVYASIAESPFHKQARFLLNKAQDEGSTRWISRQILREYLAVTTRFNSGSNRSLLDIKVALEDIEYFLTCFSVADDNEAVSQQALSLLKAVPTLGKQVHDANIVATMFAYEIPVLLTANTQDFQRFKDKITIQGLVMPSSKA